MDHPRTCGEKISIITMNIHHLGSPPHMRGKEDDGIYISRIDGITPAHAGKSNSFFSQKCFPWDHPRTCGEKFRKNETGLQLSGSPPHMRGKGTTV